MNVNLMLHRIDSKTKLFGSSKNCLQTKNIIIKNVIALNNTFNAISKSYICSDETWPHLKFNQSFQALAFV
jgi:hypothetical protein